MATGLVMVSHHVLQGSKDERYFGQQEIFIRYNGVTTRLYGEMTFVLLNGPSCMKTLYLSLSGSLFM